jgi:hypothetical protein
VTTAKQLLLHEIEDTPEPILAAAVDFIRFLKNKAVRETLETTLLSQGILERDWLQPAEDEAWRDL